MTVNTRLPDDRPFTEGEAPEDRGVVISAVIGLVVGGLLWLGWEPTTRECNTISECLGQPMSAAAMTLGGVIAVLVARRLLGVRPVFLPTVLGFVGGGALLLMIQGMGNVWPQEIHAPLAPWWSWLLVGGVIGGLTHWVHQPRRRWVERIVPVAVVLGLVIAGFTWVSMERGHRQLAELESVGVATVLAPTFDDFSVSHASRGQAEDVGALVRLSLFPHDAPAPRWPDAYLIPVRDRDLCELAISVTGDSPELTCVATDAGVELTDTFTLGAGVVEGDTLLLVTAWVSLERDEPDEWTLEQLHSAVANRVPTTLEELRDGDVD